MKVIIAITVGFFACLVGFNYFIVGPNPLWYHISSRSYFTVKVLLKAGVNPNSCGPHDCPLFIAAVAEDIRMIKLLEDHGANIHILNRVGQNVLNAQCSNTRVLKYFVDKGVNINNQQMDRMRRPEKTPLHCAVLDNSPEAVKFLVAHGADKTKAISTWAGRNNVTPLQLAELKQYHGLVPLLR